MVFLLILTFQDMIWGCKPPLTETKLSEETKEIGPHAVHKLVFFLTESPLPQPNKSKKWALTKMHISSPREFLVVPGRPGIVQGRVL